MGKNNLRMNKIGGRRITADKRFRYDSPKLPSGHFVHPPPHWQTVTIFYPEDKPSDLLMPYLRVK